MKQKQVTQIKRLLKMPVSRLQDVPVPFGGFYVWL